ncbi:MAG: transcriptional regulator [Geminicoccaceae bacterium]|nr:MAG: transcriptional regulator [Geminicoccaceae bacterium]
MTALDGFHLVPHKRVEVLIDAAVQPRLVRRLEGLDHVAFTVLPAMAGQGSQGAWNREGGLGAAGRYTRVMCEVEPDKLDALLALMTDLVHNGTAHVSVFDMTILRERQG